MADAPFFREAGSGPGVVCLHSNAASSSQWRALMDRLAPRHRVLAPDAHGAGKGPRWPADRPVMLADEAALVQPVLDAAGERFDLVGHSHGGAVALVAALAQPARVRALLLYEPTLFAVVEAEAPHEVDGIRRAVAAAGAALDAGDRDRAAACFIDFWMGEGAWARTPDARKAPIAEATVNVRGWAQALFGEPTPLRAFAALQMPVLLMTGSASPLSARAVVQRLQRVLPQAEVVRFDGLGHMGPLTHPEEVNRAIAEFLDRR